MLWLHGHYLMATMAYVPLVFLAAKRRSLLGVIPAAGFSSPTRSSASPRAPPRSLWERWSWRFVVPAILHRGRRAGAAGRRPCPGRARSAGEAGWFYRDGFRSWLWLAGSWRRDGSRARCRPTSTTSTSDSCPLAGAVVGARRERFFAAMAVIALALATLYPLPVWISSVSFSLPTRYLFFFTFGATVCFARALELRPMKAWMEVAVILLVVADLGPRFARWNPGSIPPSSTSGRPPPRP
jgi:hypothetical protein